MSKYITLRDILKKPDPIVDTCYIYTVYLFHNDMTITKVEHITDVLQNDFGNLVLANRSRTYVYKMNDIDHIEMRRE